MVADECGVCLSLPEGEVHQCHEGHCYCVNCWRRLDPRRCPECRLPLPEANRNRAAERAIAALEASCKHCGEVTTRGAMAAHLLAKRTCLNAHLLAKRTCLNGMPGWYESEGPRDPAGLLTTREYYYYYHDP